MIFAIVWGSVVFVGEGVARRAFNGHRHHNSGVVLHYDAAHRGDLFPIRGTDVNDLVPPTHRLHGGP